MAVAPDQQRRRLRGFEILQPAPPSPAAPLSDCIDSVSRQWRRDGGLAGLWRDWPTIAGDQLSPHCRPLSLRRGVLTIGASHPQWRQALQYNRHQLLAALKTRGHPVRDLRIQQHHSVNPTRLDSEQRIWERHPSRADIHGMGTCPSCSRPAPNGEIRLWAVCGFCHRQSFAS